MPTRFPGRFMDAPEGYSREQEQIFRREMETMALALFAYLEGLSRGSNAQASVHSTTKSFVFDDIGQETIT